jgi:hypothetical protein
MPEQALIVRQGRLPLRKFLQVCYLSQLDAEPMVWLLAPCCCVAHAQASTVAADPLTKILEVCHVPQPDADIPVNMMDSPWPARVK